MGAGTASGTGAGSGGSSELEVTPATAAATAAGHGATVTAGGNVAVTAGTAAATAQAYGATITNTTAPPTPAVIVGGGGSIARDPFRFEHPLPEPYVPPVPVYVEAVVALAGARAHGAILTGAIDEFALRRIMAEDEELILAGVL